MSTLLPKRKSKKKKNKRMTTNNTFLNEDAEDLVTFGIGSDTYSKQPDGTWARVGTKTSTPTSGYKSSAPSTGYKTLAQCKHAGDVAFQTRDGVVFYGATGWDADFFGIDVVFDLAKTATSSAISESRRIVKYVYSGPTELNELLEPMPTFVDIAWPDMSIMYGAGPRFWHGIKAYIDQQVALPGANRMIMATCTGGNGRTGTFLSIMYGFYFGANAKDSIEAIRVQYCKHAVETPMQEKYIAWILDGTPLY